MQASPLLHSINCQRAFACPLLAHSPFCGSTLPHQSRRQQPCSGQMQHGCRAQKKGFGASKTKSKRV